jgi:adenylate cyclase
MRVAESGRTATRPGRAAVAGAIAVVFAPLVLLAVLRLRPAWDLTWENHPAHFWLVLAASAVAVVLGYTVSTAARRRQDARLFVISLAFLSAAGFLGLHALATPGVLVGPNAGFELATPVGLVLGSVFVAVSALDFSPEASRRIMRWSRAALAALATLMAVWAVFSLAELPPLDDPVQEEALHGWQLIFAAVGIAGYGAGSFGYLRLYQRRGARFVFAVAVAFALLAVSILIIAFAVNWRISWWEWHVVMLAAFGLIGFAAREEWHQERFSALYLEQTLRGAREVTVLFADLQGFTAFTGRSSPRDLQAMLDTYLSRLVPLLRDHGGEVHKLIGDEIMVVFNKQGDQPDHAALAAAAALAFADAAADIARTHPDWPRFRVGVNSGEAIAGVLGERGHREHDVVGDTVNLAARLQSQAPVGDVVIGEGTYDRLPDGAVVERMPPLTVKGRDEPVTAYVLRSLPADKAPAP